MEAYGAPKGNQRALSLSRSDNAVTKRLGKKRARADSKDECRAQEGE